MTSRQYGTFTGVFAPTLLSIFGVILFLRLGWVIGHAGILGTLAILSLSLGLAACTAAALATISTNTPLRDGGAYGIINRSLGREVGGAIGLPLYLSMPFGTALAVVGCREGVLWALPQAPALLIDLLLMSGAILMALRDRELFFRLQWVTIVCLLGAFLSILASPAMRLGMGQPQMWGVPRLDFWSVFAVFFPASTGILAGVTLSGQLNDPRRSIPVGSLGALATASATYLLFVVWLSRMAPASVLRSDYTVLIDRSGVPVLTVLGLLTLAGYGATAGLSRGARMLQTMASSAVFPGSNWLAQTDRSGTPRHAFWLTALIATLALIWRDLNTLAPLVAMFLLLTWCLLNVVVLTEIALQLVSFRPTLRVPRLVPAVGAAGSIFAMLAVNPAFAVVALGVVGTLYVYLESRQLASDGEDVRSSAFAAVAEWAANRVQRLGPDNPRAWKPNLLVPVEDPDSAETLLPLWSDLIRPEGHITVLALATETSAEELRPRAESLVQRMTTQGLFARHAVVDAAGFSTGTAAGLQALQSAFFRPNLLFLELGEPERDLETIELLEHARVTGVGALVLARKPETSLRRRGTVNLWVQHSPTGWDVHDAFKTGNLNVGILTAYRLQQQWNGTIHLKTVVPSGEDVPYATIFLDRLARMGRLPTHTKTTALVGDFRSSLAGSPADMHILGLQYSDLDLVRARALQQAADAHCLFVLDSGRESALA